jgi:hypothetical protein
MTPFSGVVLLNVAVLRFLMGCCVKVFDRKNLRGLRNNNRRQDQVGNIDLERK